MCEVKWGICFSVILSCCVSSATPNARLARATDQKAPAGLGQLVNKPLPLPSPCMRAGPEATCELGNRRVPLMLPSRSRILDQLHKNPPISRGVQPRPAFICSIRYITCLLMSQSPSFDSCLAETPETSSRQRATTLSLHSWVYCLLRRQSAALKQFERVRGDGEQTVQGKHSLLAFNGNTRALKSHRDAAALTQPLFMPVAGD